MTTRQLPLRVRTPRKVKTWALRTADGVTVPTGGQDVLSDLLQSYRTVVGDSATERVTVMRILGNLALGNSASASSNAVPVNVDWGIAWVSSSIASASTGDSQIPAPGIQGPRATRWIQRGRLYGTTVQSVATRYADAGQLRSFVDIDTEQMRKQPSAGDRLVLIVQNNGAAADALELYWHLQIMLALP